MTMTWMQALGWQLAAGPPQTGWTWEERRAAYDRWDAYVANTIYLPQAAGGFRESINATLGNAAAADLAGLYSPFAAVVDLYLHVFGGRFRGPADDPADDAPTDIRLSSPHAATVDALHQVVTWSNLTIERQSLCRLAATHGTVGLRIVARDSDRPAQRRVYVTPEHPRTIRDVALDDRGNVIAIELEYDVSRGVGEAAEAITVRETMDKTTLATYRVVAGDARDPLDVLAWQAGADHGPNAIRPNALGVVPYVLLRHEYDGGVWGRNAFARACAPADRLNALLTHLDVQIHDHVRATWLVAASGKPPAEFDFSGRKVIYVDTTSGSVPAIEALVANLDLGGARQEAELHLSLIEDALPELKAIVGKYLSGQSGETIAQLRRPAEDRLRLARTNYEDALGRALQIALSWGVMLECWNLGTGVGSREAADAAYTGGLENFTFNDRPLLDAPPGTPEPPPAARRARAAAAPQLADDAANNEEPAE